MIKRTLCLILSLCMMFSCAVVAECATVDTSAVSADYVLADNVQDGQILQCWNWSFDNIRDNMALIAEQGFTAVQTSPVQPTKESTKESWSTAGKSMWVFYQPIGFTIEQNTRSALGTKDDFEAMCDEAHKYGVKVIVDTVFNHLANENAGNTICSQIPSDIADDDNCWHSVDTNISNYSDRYDITHHCLGGLPDLNTGSSKIQNYAIDFMKECIDAGADGFRFDAAKHIETPSDSSSVRSDFWPNVLSEATSYAQSTRDITPYYYGELLDSPGGSLSISAYTQYMSVTDNQGSNSIRNSVVSGSASGACKSSISNGASTSKTVQWNESHDTYNEGSSSSVSDTNLKKTWAIVGSRAKVCGMYLARPSSSSTKLGAADITAWADKEVKEINKFKNSFVGESEYFAYSGSTVYVERGTKGVVLVNVSGGSKSVSVTANRMENGTYTDAITGNTFTVSGGKISGNIGSTGIAVVYNQSEIEEPTEEVTQIPTDEPTDSTATDPSVPPTEEPTDPTTPVSEPATEETKAPTGEAGYYIVGTLNGENCWGATSLTPERMLSDTDGDGIYTLDWTFYMNDELKVVYFDGYDITKWYKDSGQPNYKIGSDEKTGLCTVSFDPTGSSGYSYTYFTVKQKPEQPTVEETFEPTEPSVAPTEKETEAPTVEPTEAPTQAETEEPSEETQAPTQGRPNKVENVVVTSTTANTAELSWDQCGDCFKYWVYMLNEDTGEWVIQTRSGTTSAVVKNLDPDTTYKFKVTGKFASDNAVLSVDNADEYTATTAKAAAPAEISAGTDLDQINISWDEVEGATKYWLYKSTSSDGPFAINGSTTTNSIAVTKFYPETTYYFKVTSYTMQNGIPCISDIEDSPVIEVTTPSAASVATVLETKTDTTATISWPSVETATKYWVYYSTTTNDTTDMSQWKLYNSVTDMSVNELTLRNLAPNTKYFVTVKVLYTNTSGEPKEYIYAPTGLITTYSAGEFLTFAEHPQNSNYFTITWPEDSCLDGKVWVYSYDAQGNRTIVNSVTGANTLNVKKFDGYEDCYYELETFIATGMYGYLTPIGGEKYHN